MTGYETDYYKISLIRLKEINSNLASIADSLAKLVEIETVKSTNENKA